MTTPATTITMGDIQTEFLGSNPIGLDEYYAGGIYVSAGVTGVATSGTITMGELRSKANPNYGTLSPNFTTRAEGQSVTFSLSGGNIGSGTLYWRVVYDTNVTSEDFSAVTGSFTVSDSVGSFVVTIVNDALDDGAGSFHAVVGVSVGAPVAYITSAVVSITESVTYTITAVTNPNPYRFGAATTAERLVTAGVSTTNLATGTTIYWNITNITGTVTTSDIDAISGSFVTNGSGVGVLTMTVVNVLTASGATPTVASKAYRVNYYKDAARTLLIGSSTTITLRASPSFSVSWSPTTINEGSNSTFTVIPSNFPVNNSLYFTSSGTATPTSDISAGSSGSLGVYTGPNISGIFTGYFDAAAEGAETYTANVRNTSISGTIVATATLTINQALGTVTSLALTKTGGSISGQPVEVFVQITSIAAYPLSRAFVLHQSINGGAYTATATTITVNANATSSANTSVHTNANPTTSYTSYNVKTVLAGHSDKISTALTAPLYL